MSLILNCEVKTLQTGQLTDDSVFVHEAIKEAVESTGLSREEIFPFSNRLRESILRKAQELKNEYNQFSSEVR